MSDAGGWINGPEMNLYRTLPSGSPDPGQAVFLEPIQPVLTCDDIVPSSSWGACGTTVATGSAIDLSVGVVTDAAGGAFIGWRESVSGVRLNRVTTSGALASGWPSNGVLVAADSSPSSPSLVPDGSGGVFAVWSGRSWQQQQPTTILPALTDTGHGAWLAQRWRAHPGIRLTAPDGSGGVYIVVGPNESKPCGWRHWLPSCRLAAAGCALPVITGLAGTDPGRVRRPRLVPVVARVAGNASILWQTQTSLYTTSRSSVRRRVGRRLRRLRQLRSTATSAG